MTSINPTAQITAGLSNISINDENQTPQITAGFSNVSINSQEPQTNNAQVTALATAAVAGPVLNAQQEQQSSVLYIDADPEYSSPPQTPRPERRCPPPPARPSKFARRG